MTLDEFLAFDTRSEQWPQARERWLELPAEEVDALQAEIRERLSICDMEYKVHREMIERLERERDEARAINKQQAEETYRAHQALIARILSAAKERDEALESSACHKRNEANALKRMNMAIAERDEAYERAAQVVEEMAVAAWDKFEVQEMAAERIRALKTKPG